MDWKKYEEEIFDAFRHSYPDAQIKYNQKITGRFSKIQRQVDVLIEGRIAGNKLKIIIDGKYYSKKIDVKDVESFITMAADVEAAQGILITSKGYSQGAINRAYYDPADIELDILSISELTRFQGIGGHIHSGWHGAVLPAPFGWIIDGTRREIGIATLYQRGITFEKAFENGEFIYANIFPYDENIKNLEEVLEFHKKETSLLYPAATFKYFDSIERQDKSKTLVRKILRETTHLEEYTGFVSFEDFCVFLVLLTPKELSKKNVRKLEYCLERIIPTSIHLPSVAATEIAFRNDAFENAETDEEKANILIDIGDIHQDMEEFEKAKETYFKSIEFISANYGARLGLLKIGFETEERGRLIDDFYNVFPGHIQICDDLVLLCIENKQFDFLESFFKKKSKIHAGKYEKLGNIYFSWAKLNYLSKKKAKALKYFKSAQENYGKCFDNSHPINQTVNEAINELENG